MTLTMNAPDAALLHDTRNQIQLDTATRRERCGLSPVPGR